MRARLVRLAIVATILGAPGASLGADVVGPDASLVDAVADGGGGDVAPADASPGQGGYALPANVLVIANQLVDESIAVAEGYMAKRGVPQENLLLVECPSDYQIPYDEYLSCLQEPLKAHLVSSGAKDDILILLTTWGVPGTITGHGEVVMFSDEKAVDSYLVDPFGEVPDDVHPYYGAEVPFTREAGFVGYLVSRLDGPSPEAALAMVDKALAAEAMDEGPQGLGYFDQEPFGDTPFDQDVIAGAGGLVNPMIEEAYELTLAAGYQASLDTNDEELGTPPALEWCPDALWYTGWYQLHHYNDAFEWATGAVGVHVDSFSAMQFRTEGCWVYGAIEAGITGTAGAVWEPHVSGFVDTAIMLDRFLVGGLNLVEAMHAGTKKIRWMVTVFGDPLYALDRTYPEPPEPPEPPVELVEEVEPWSDVVMSDTVTSDLVMSDLAATDGSKAEVVDAADHEQAGPLDAGGDGAATDGGGGETTNTEEEVLGSLDGGSGVDALAPEGSSGKGSDDTGCGMMAERAGGPWAWGSLLFLVVAVLGLVPSSRRTDRATHDR